jgi:flagellin
MAVINTNISAVITQNAMLKNDRDMQTTMERLSTGKSVNSAQDDAAGIAVSSRMTSQIRGLDRAVQNAGDAISMIQTADGASIEIANMMQRMRELAVQATNGTVTSTDQGSLDLEFQQLKAEIGRVANNSQWNGNNILDGTAGTSSNGTATFQIGANSQQVVDVGFGNWNLNAPTSNIIAVYNSGITSATAAAIDGAVTLSDGTTNLRIDYASTIKTAPTDLADLVVDIKADPVYNSLDFTVAVDSAGTGLDFTYKTAGAVASPPVFTADDGGVEVAGNVTVSTAGVSVAAVAGVYRTALTDANVAAIDGNVVLSDGEHSLTVDASGASTVAALTSLITSHAEHADLGFTVSQTTAVTGVPAAFTISALANADVTSLANAGSPITLSDGTTTIEVTTTGTDMLAGTDTLANLVTVIQAHANYAAFDFTVTANSTTGLLLTSKTNGPATTTPSIIGNTTHAVANSVVGVTEVPAGLTFTYDDAKAVLSTPTITADDGGVNIANAMSVVTAGVTALSSVYGRDLTALTIATDTGANEALADLDAALDGINAQRAVFGAGMNRLEYTIDNLSNGSMNAKASRSRIEDADYAAETTELARTQIIQQASTAMLAQANQSNQSVLSLLKG